MFAFNQFFLKIEENKTKKEQKPLFFFLKFCLRVVICGSRNEEVVIGTLGNTFEV